METRKLVALLEAVRLGSISKASEKMGYTQSGMTQMINSLEEEIGVPLLKRHHNGVALTTQGKALEAHIRAVVESENSLRTWVSEIGRNVNGHICIGTYASIAVNLLPEIIKDFEREHMAVDIEIKIGSADIADWVAMDKVDFGFTERSLAGNYEWIPTHDDQLYAAVPISYHLPNDAISLDALLEKYHLLASSSTGDSATEQALRGRTVQSKIKVQTPSCETLLSMVRQNMGIALIPRLYLQGGCPGVNLIPIDPPIIRELGVFAKSFKALKPVTKIFLDCLIEHAKRLER